MKDLDMEAVRQFVNENVDTFHVGRLNKLQTLKVNRLIEKNPYLFRAKNVTLASEMIRGMMDAFLSSSEEELFGVFLEELAIYVCGLTLGGHKSSSEGLDLEFSDEVTGRYYVVAIKSGKNWGNSSQHKAMIESFGLAAKRLRQSRHTKEVQPTLGICYGKTRTSYMEQGYLKVVGQNFWTLISGNRDLYKEIIEPVGYQAKQHNDKYVVERSRIENLLTQDFMSKFCNDGEIDWARLVEANSGNYDLNKRL